MEEGLQIANRVDSLREAAAREEQALEEYRINTLTRIQSEINKKQLENEQLSVSNKSLKEERIRLEAPLDLVQIWKEVHVVEEKNDSLAENLLYREINVSKRENDVQETKNNFLIREKEIQRSKQSAEQNLRRSEEQRSEADVANREAQDILSKMKKEQEAQKLYHETKTNDLSEREEAVILREEEIEKERIVINKEKILLADRRATLERGFAELRRKQT